MCSWTGFDEAKIIRGKAQSSNQKLDKAFDHPDAEEPPILKEVTNGNGSRIIFLFGLFGGCAVHLKPSTILNPIMELYASSRTRCSIFAGVQFVYCWFTLLRDANRMHRFSLFVQTTRATLRSFMVSNTPRTTATSRIKLKPRQSLSLKPKA